jgi:hypothetical protein
MDSLQLKISGPSSIFIMENEKKKVILLGDIHIKRDYDKNTCKNFIVPDKKIDYFIEYSHYMIENPSISENTQVLKDYAECVVKNDKYFNAYLIDYRKQLPLSNLMFLLIELQNAKVEIDGIEMYRTEDVINILKKIEENLSSLNLESLRSSLKMYFNITNSANNIRLNPDSKILKFYVSSTNSLLKNSNEIILPFLENYEILKSKMYLTNSEYIKAETLNTFLLSFFKVYRFLSTITEKIFDTYVLTGILNSPNDIVIVQTGQQHIDTYIKFLEENGFTLTYTYKPYSTTY